MLSPGYVHARQATEIRVAERSTLPVPGASPLLREAHQLTLTLVYFTAGDWPRDAVVAAAVDAAQILGQCGVRLRQVELVRVDAPERYHYLDTPVSRQLARTLRLAKPTVYFVTDTRQEPAFDAEAIGRANSATRPELANSVWVTRATRDVAIALAHELVHVLMDSGEHADLPGNLMRERTAPQNTRLTDAQCARLRSMGAKNGLLAR